MDLAVFFREPSAWGATPDRRLLSQVVRNERFEPVRTLRLGHVAVRIAGLFGIRLSY